MVLRPLAKGDEVEVRRIHATDEVARWWGLPDDDFPWDEPEVTRLVVEVEGRVVGLVQYSEHPDPEYRRAEVDLFIDPAVHGRGLGREAVTRLIQHLVGELGHHRVTTDPAADNLAAIRAYEKAGFRRVGVMRRYERDTDGQGWHDGVLMELVIDDAQ